MKQKVLSIAIAASIVLSGVMNASATGVVAGATEPTQILNNVQLVLSYIEQAQQTEHQFAMMLQGIQNLKQTFTGAALQGQIQRMFSDLNMVQSFSNLRNSYVNGQQFSYSGANTDSLFRSLYPAYGAQLAMNGSTFQQKYTDWSLTSRDAMISASRMAGFQEDNLMNEASFLYELQNKVDNPFGATSAVQAGAQASMAVVSQLQQLRQLQMSQINAQNAFAMKQSSSEDDQQAVYKAAADARAKHYSELHPGN